MNVKHPAQIISETLQDPYPRGPMPALIIAALREAGWHLISTPTAEQTDEPPIPDAALEHPRYGFDPYRKTTLSAHLDGEVITATGTVNRYTILRADPGYLAHARAELGHDFLAMVGHKLGVPGCEDLPDRLAKTGHP